MGRDDIDRRALDTRRESAPDTRRESALEREDTSSGDAIARFVAEAAAKARRTVGGRLIFGLDATASRQPTWDRARDLQAAMFDEAGRIGDLEVQLVYYRGGGECRSSRWLGDARTLRDLMGRIACRAGPTELGRVFAHAAAEARERPVAALAFVGDALEEAPGPLYDLAGELALLGVACFMFQEGRDQTVATAFAEIARLTGGAHVPFDTSAAGRLGDLLRAVAAYATGGRAALHALADRSEGEGARLLIGGMKS